ncbi:MAG: Gfo/Idh/MocA family oxidoreductase [Phycisphaerae bacterium]|nr:Gfo/Idh/MocA family oxidoreductase [Phycisphaerae bacterium]
MGLIGLGFMGKMHLSAYTQLAGAEVVAVADKDPKRAGGDLAGGWSNLEGGAEQLDMSRIFGTTDFSQVLERDDVDMVDICVPTPFHEALVLDALSAGKHVLCEKPLALSSEAAARMAQAADAATGFFMPAMCIRFWPGWNWLKQAVDGGKYGKLLGLRVTRTGGIPGGWFSDGTRSGGAILDLHIHDTDFVYHLLGSPEAVFSRGFSCYSGRTDRIVTQYLYPEASDAPSVVAAEGAWLEEGHPFAMRYLASFERATAEYESSAQEPLKLTADKNTEAVAIESADGYVGEIRYFVECIEAGRPPQVVTAADAVQGLRIAEAEQRSVESGRVEAVAGPTGESSASHD